MELWQPHRTSLPWLLTLSSSPRRDKQRATDGPAPHCLCKLSGQQVASSQVCQWRLTVKFAELLWHAPQKSEWFKSEEKHRWSQPTRSERVIFLLDNAANVQETHFLFFLFFLNTWAHLKQVQTDSNFKIIYESRIPLCRIEQLCPWFLPVGWFFLAIILPFLLWWNHLVFLCTKCFEKPLLFFFFKNESVLIEYKEYHLSTQNVYKVSIHNGLKIYSDSKSNTIQVRKVRDSHGSVELYGYVTPAK